MVRLETDGQSSSASAAAVQAATASSASRLRRHKRWLTGSISTGFSHFRFCCGWRHSLHCLDSIWQSRPIWPIGGQSTSSTADLPPSSNLIARQSLFGWCCWWWWWWWCCCWFANDSFTVTHSGNSGECRCGFQCFDRFSAHIAARFAGKGKRALDD